MVVMAVSVDVDGFPCQEELETKPFQEPFEAPEVSNFPCREQCKEYCQEGKTSPNGVEIIENIEHT